ncbi:MAG: peptidyl-prolyl cis-trans isomerase [Myxococcales bacterium]|nr:peptidyl-prolyl cis-trans isomerase [Myxococcales bacterium]
MVRGRSGAGLEPSAAELDALVRAAAAGTPPRADGLPDAGAPSPGAAARAAERLNTTPAVVREVARDLVLARLLATALVEAVPEAEVEQAWRAENSRATARLVSVPRVPTAREIDAAERTRDADITAWYQRNLHRFRTPERAEVLRLFVAAPADDPAARAKARAKVEALRARVAGGEAFEQVARDASEGPFAQRGGAVGLVGRKRLPLAFEQAVGALGPAVDEPAGVAAYRVVRRVPAVDRPLSDPRVHREAAAAILEEDDTLPHARAVADRARQALTEGADGPALDALVEAERLVLETTPPFARSAAPLVPGVGLAPTLFDDLFARTPEAPVTAVHRVRQHYVVGRRLTFEAPAPDAWAKARETYAPAWRARQRGRAVEDWLQGTLKDAQTWVDVERLGAVQVPGVGAATDR